jgi:hypothetical protein
MKLFKNSNYNYKYLLLILLILLIIYLIWRVSKGKEGFESKTCSYCNECPEATNIIAVGNKNDGKKIDTTAFFGCTNLTSVTISDSVTSIGENAFDACIKLANLTIGNSVANIGYKAFSGTIITSINIPTSVTSMGGEGGYIFSSCTELAQVIFLEDSKLKIIPQYSFLICIKLTSIVIPNSVMSIGRHAFAGCIALATVTIGTGVTSIEEEAFSGCTSLISIDIPNNVTLEEPRHPTNIKKGEAGAFEGCINLANVTINYNSTDYTIPIQNWYKNAFANTNITQVTINSNTVINDDDIDKIKRYFNNFNKTKVTYNFKAPKATTTKAATTTIIPTTPKPITPKATTTKAATTTIIPTTPKPITPKAETIISQTPQTSQIPTDNFNKLYYYNVINKSIPHENINFFEFNNTDSKIFANLKGTNTVGFYFKLPETNIANSYKIISSNNYNENNNLDTFTNPIWSLNFVEGNFYIKYKQNKIQQKYKFNIIVDNTEIIYIKIAYNSNSKILRCNINGDEKIIYNIKYYKNILLFGNNSSKLNNDITDTKTSNKPNNMLVGDIKIENIYDPYLKDKILICKYNPSKDKTKYNCVHKCLKLNNCNQPKCDKICKYIAGSDFKGEDTRTDKEPDPPSNVRVIPQDNGFTIEFIKPEYEGYNAKITKYIVVVKNKFTKLKNINDEKIYSFNSNNDSELKYSIKGLDNNNMYNIFVLSYNDKSLISKTASEIETNSPDGTSEEIHDLLIEPDSVISKQINDYIGEHLDEKDDYCKAEDKFNFNLINLDKIDRNEYQNKIKQIVLDNEVESEMSNSIKNTIANNPILKNSDEEDISINEMIQDSNSVSILKDFENYN